MGLEGALQAQIAGQAHHIAIRAAQPGAAAASGAGRDVDGGVRGIAGLSPEEAVKLEARSCLQGHCEVIRGWRQ